MIYKGTAKCSCGKPATKKELILRGSYSFFCDKCYEKMQKYFSGEKEKSNE